MRGGTRGIPVNQRERRWEYHVKLAQRDCHGLDPGRRGCTPRAGLPRRVLSALQPGRRVPPLHQLYSPVDRRGGPVQHRHGSGLRPAATRGARGQRLSGFERIPRARNYNRQAPFISVLVHWQKRPCPPDQYRSDLDSLCVPCRTCPALELSPCTTNSDRVCSAGIEIDTWIQGVAFIPNLPALAAMNVTYSTVITDATYPCHSCRAPIIITTSLACVCHSQRAPRINPS